MHYHYLVEFIFFLGTLVIYDEDKYQKVEGYWLDLSV